MKKSLSLSGWSISFDPDEVRNYYENAVHDWCQCNRCYNWHIVRERFVPDALRKQLMAFGLNLGNCLWDHQSSSTSLLFPGYHRIRPNYIVPGRIVVEGRNPVFHYGKQGSIWITEERRREIRDRTIDFHDITTPVIYLRVRLPVPYLPAQMLSFDQHNDFRCPACNLTEFYVKGRLKSDSLIPRWYGVELGSRAQDFDVCFCVDCGTPRFLKRR